MSDLRILDLGNPTGRTGASTDSNWWAAYCSICREYVTKFDFTAEDSRRYGEAHLREKHGRATLFEDDERG